MALSITHAKVSAIADVGDATLVEPSDWNASHTLTGAASPTQGGTGTATTFTAGSIIFADVSGNYTQNNTRLFWDDTNHFMHLLSDSAGLTSATHPLLVESKTTGTNDARYILALYANTTGTAAAGLNGTLRWLLPNTNGTAVFAADLNVFWDTPTAGGEYSKANFDIISNAASYTAWSVNYDGSFQWRPFFAKTTSRSPDAAGEMPSVYETNAAALTINLQDSSAYAGKTVTVLVSNAGGATINAVTGKVIYFGGAATAASGHIVSTTVGATVVLMSDNTGNYWVTGTSDKTLWTVV